MTRGVMARGGWGALGVRPGVALRGLPSASPLPPPVPAVALLCGANPRCPQAGAKSPALLAPAALTGGGKPCPGVPRPPPTPRHPRGDRRSAAPLLRAGSPPPPRCRQPPPPPAAASATREAPRPPPRDLQPRRARCRGRCSPAGPPRSTPAGAAAATGAVNQRGAAPPPRSPLAAAPLTPLIGAAAAARPYIRRRSAGPAPSEAGERRSRGRSRVVRRGEASAAGCAPAAAGAPGTRLGP